MSENTQTLPAGLAGRAAAATVEAPAAVAPSVAAPAPAPVVASPADAVQVPEHQQKPPAQPAPAAPVVPAAAPEPAKAPELKPVEVPGDKPAAAPEQSANVTAMVGHLASDPNLAPAVNYLDTFCKDAGVDMARAFGQAADEEDARFIDRAYLKEKLGDKADDVIRTAESVLQYAVAYGEQTVAEVHKLAGTEQGWDLAAKAFNQAASPEDKAIIGAMLDSGDRTKVLYAAKQILQYATQAGATVTHHAPQLGAPGAMRGLSNAEYIKAIQERGVTPEKYEQLKQQRMLGRSQGL